MSQGFWMPKEVGDSHDSEVAYDNSSRMDAKRSHQWFMNGPEADLFPSKKQAVEVPNNNSFLGMLNSNSSPWALAPGFQPLSGHFGEQLFDTDAPRTVNYDERSIQSIGTEKFNVGRKAHEDLFVNDSSFALSMSHVSEDPGSSLNYGGVRKVKVSEVKDTEPIMPVASGHSYNRLESSAMFSSPAFVKADENPISLSLPSSLGEDNTISLGNNNGDRGDSIIMSMGKPNETEENISMGQSYREDGSGMSINHIIGKDENIMAIGHSYRADDCSISMNHMYNKGNHDSVAIGNSYNKGGNNMGHSFCKGQSTIISFGGYDEDTNPADRLVYNYELLMGQHSAQTSHAINDIDLVKSNGDAFANASQINLSGIDNSSKKKDEQNGSKKATSNNFPSNVRSLLSTGILDGVLVKYIAWSREKELRGVIKGTGYLCGCQSCNYNKVINAYEFERHAGCKTKHPNNHIYFENGKTIYGIVQELRSTPQNMLFDVMQTITGSPINQKSFRLWKESYLAATRELQRIYGKDDGRQFS